MQTIGDNLDAIRIVQIGDRHVDATSVPNRRVPGEGSIPSTGWCRGGRARLHRLVDLELLGPVIDEEGPENAMARGLEWMRIYVP